MGITATRIAAPGAWLRPNADTATNPDIDLIAVERVANGDLDPATLTTAERAEVWRLLISHGIGYTVAARITGNSTTEVHDWGVNQGLLKPWPCKTTT